MIIPSPILYLDPLAPPPFPRAQLFWVLYRLNQGIIQSVPWIRKCSSDLRACKVTSAPQILLPAACIWKRLGSSAIPCGRNRWIAKRVSRVAHKRHYHDGTKSSPLPPTVWGSTPFLGPGLIRPCSPTSQSHTELLSISLWEIWVWMEIYK